MNLFCNVSSVSKSLPLTTYGIVARSAHLELCVANNLAIPYTTPCPTFGCYGNGHHS